MSQQTKNSRLGSFLKEYFTFSRKEQQGTILLLLILFLLIITNIVVSKMGKSQVSDIDYAKYQSIVDSFYKHDSVTAVSVRKNKPFISNKIQKTESSRVDKIIEINMADSASLEKLPGIGPVLARRIIKYRKLVGGFNSINQLQEVYGFTPDLLQKAKSVLRINNRLIVKLNLDTSNYFQLAKHPYLGRDMAKQIMALRKQGIPVTKEVLFNKAILDSIRWKKLEPYIMK